MSNNEATAKKTEENEKGATSTVNYKDIQMNRRRTKIALYVVGGVIVLVGIVALIITFTRPTPVPMFMLDDVYIDPVSKSDVLVELSSTNPSSSSIYYSKMSVRMRIKEIFETEKAFLQSTRQEPHERTTWTAVVAKNNVKPDGTFQMRDGLKDGKVIAHVKIRKIIGIFNLNSRFRVTCPVLLNLRNLTAEISRRSYLSFVGVPPSVRKP